MLFWNAFYFFHLLISVPSFNLICSFVTGSQIKNLISSRKLSSGTKEISSLSQWHVKAKYLSIIQPLRHVILFHNFTSWNFISLEKWTALENKYFLMPWNNQHTRREYMVQTKVNVIFLHLIFMLIIAIWYPVFEFHFFCVLLISCAFIVAYYFESNVLPFNFFCSFSMNISDVFFSTFNLFA